MAKGRAIRRVNRPKIGEHLTFAKKCSGSVSLPRNLIGSETLPLPIYENEMLPKIVSGFEMGLR
jgi:hypothetical protein